MLRIRSFRDGFRYRYNSGARNQHTAGGAYEFHIHRAYIIYGYSQRAVEVKIILIRAYGSHVTTRQQLEYTAPTGFRFLDEPMFCFSTLNANTNPNPNCRPGHRPWPLTPWQSLPGRRPWPLTPWQSLPGHRPWPLTRFIM